MLEALGEKIRKENEALEKLLEQDEKEALEDDKTMAYIVRDKNSSTSPLPLYTHIHTGVFVACKHQDQPPSFIFDPVPKKRTSNV